MTTAATMSGPAASTARRGRLGYLGLNGLIHGAMVGAVLLVHSRLNDVLEINVLDQSGAGDALIRVFLPAGLGLVLLVAVVCVLRLRAMYRSDHHVSPLGDLSVGVGAQVALLVPVAYALVLWGRVLEPWGFLEIFWSPGLLVGALVAVALLPLPVAGLRRWVSWEHGRAAQLLGHPRPAPAAPLRGGPRARLRQLLRDPVTRRGVLWLPAYGTSALACSAVGAGFVLVGLDGVRGVLSWQNINASSYLFNMVGPRAIAIELHTNKLAWMSFCLAEVLLAVAAIWFVGPRLASLQARMSALLLALPTAGQRAAELAERVGVLTETRSGAVDAHAAELRRIERDLHDGTQAQLVNVAMRLGMVERSLPDESAEVARLVRQARSGAEDAMIDLRGLLRTMYPPVLADRGLRGALLGLAGRCTVPVTVEAAELGQVPAPVEAAAYFTVAESLTNVSKHSSASHAEVTVRREGNVLSVVVSDDGLGGIDQDRGSGVVGMHRRAAALDRWLDVTSPAGGPTTVIAEFPCGS